MEITIKCLPAKVGETVHGRQMQRRPANSRFTVDESFVRQQGVAHLIRHIRHDFDCDLLHDLLRLWRFTFRYPRSAAKCSADRPSLSNTSTRAWLFNMVFTKLMCPLWQAINKGVQPTLDCRFIACCTSDGDIPSSIAVSTSLLPATAQKCNAVS